MTDINRDVLMWERVEGDEFATQLILSKTQEVIDMLTQPGRELSISSTNIALIRNRMAAAYVAGGESGQFALTISGDTEGTPNTLRYWVEDTAGTYADAVLFLGLQEQLRQEGERLEREGGYPA